MMGTAWEEWRRFPAAPCASADSPSIHVWVERNPVVLGQYLADQLLVPLALAGGGTFITPTASSHLHTNAEVIERFLPIRIRVTEAAPAVQVTVEAG